MIKVGNLKHNLMPIFCKYNFVPALLSGKWLRWNHVITSVNQQAISMMEPCYHKCESASHIDDGTMLSQV
jgi:hypothetical protein